MRKFIHIISVQSTGRSVDNDNVCRQNSYPDTINVGAVRSVFPKQVT